MVSDDVDTHGDPPDSCPDETKRDGEVGHEFGLQTLGPLVGRSRRWVGTYTWFSFGLFSESDGRCIVGLYRHPDP